METDHAKKLPIFWGHGTDDQVVKYSWGQQSVEKLRGMGYKNIDFQSYPGQSLRSPLAASRVCIVRCGLQEITSADSGLWRAGMEHSTCPEEQLAVAQFIAKVLPPTEG